MGPRLMPIIAWPVASERLANLARASDVRQPVRRTRTQPAPRLDAVKILRLKFRKIAAERFHDASHADGIDLLVQPRHFHRAADAQRVAHRRHGDARLGEDGTNLRKLARLGQREAVAFASLNRNFNPSCARQWRRPRAAGENKFIRDDSAACEVITARRGSVGAERSRPAATSICDSACAAHRAALLKQWNERLQFSNSRLRSPKEISRPTVRTAFAAPP